MKSLGKEAKIFYGDGHFEIMVPGDYVICAVTARRIHLNQLKYWSREKQEPYISCEVSFQKHQDGA